MLGAKLRAAVRGTDGETTPVSRYSAAGVSGSTWLDEAGGNDLAFSATPSIVDALGEDAVRFDGASIYAYAAASGMTVKGFRVRGYFPNGISNSTVGILLDMSDWGSPEWQSYIALGESSGYSDDETISVGDGQGFYDYGRTYSKDVFSPGVHDLDFSFSEVSSRWEIYVDGIQQTVHATTPPSRGGHARALLVEQLSIGSFGMPYHGDSLLEADVIYIELYSQAIF
ncbi:hypothetical protein [Marinobacterium stanieri]|uniref:hypothetical protein n=1 Tax=Marinobacterium stanieri TaxID=49186 RepID=UPI000255A8A9|nr:hypothetical protein [Marinobacterium stanieri]